ncbi:MAG: PilZ domain-containing protein [Candidatus Omnitrophota bacterium]
MTFPRKRGKFERFDATVPIEVVIAGTSPESRTVLCDNIGGKGFRFSIEKKLEVHASLELTVHLPDNQTPIRTKGRVSWVREAKHVPDSPEVFFEAGVEFIGLSFMDRDRIQQYIYRRAQQQPSNGNPPI